MPFSPEAQERERAFQALVRKAQERYEAMPPEAQKAMWDAQRESWARQDLD